MSTPSLTGSQGAPLPARLGEHASARWAVRPPDRVSAFAFLGLFPRLAAASKVRQDRSQEQCVVAKRRGGNLRKNAPTGG